MARTDGRGKPLPSAFIPQDRCLNLDCQSLRARTDFLLMLLQKRLGTRMAKTEDLKAHIVSVKCAKKHWCCKLLPFNIFVLHYICVPKIIFVVGKRQREQVSLSLVVMWPTIRSFCVCGKNLNCIRALSLLQELHWWKLLFIPMPHPFLSHSTGLRTRP